MRAIPKSTSDWLVEKKPVGIAPNHKLSRNKQCLFSLNTNPHAFSLHSVGVIGDETWTLSTPPLPAVRYMLWSIFFMQKDKVQPRFIIDCVVHMVILLWVTVVWENDAENSGMGALMCMMKVVKDDTQLSLTNSFKKSTSACVENVASRYQNFRKNFHKLRGLHCIKLSWIDWVNLSSVHGGYQNNWLTFTKPKEWGQPWHFFSATGKMGTNFLTEHNWWRDLGTVREYRDQRSV
jgi:hypothetical protein